MYGRLKFVKKRNGELQDFDLGKLENTIYACIQETNEFTESESAMRSSSSRIAFTVITELNHKILENKLDPTKINVDILQDTVEDVFYNFGYHNTAKQYMRFKYYKKIKSKQSEIERLQKILKTHNINYTGENK